MPRKPRDLPPELRALLRDEEVQDVFLERFFGEMAKHVIGSLANRAFDTSHFESAFDEARGDSDRSASVVVAALLDSILSQAYLWALNPKLKGGIGRLFEPNGPLSTLSGKIDFAYALHWISGHAYKDAHLIRRIRNEFAHKVAARTFDNAKVRSMVQGMTAQEEAAMLPIISEKWPDMPPLNLTTRETYLVRAPLVLAGLGADLIVRPRLLSAGLSPRRPFEELPETAQKILRAGARQGLRSMVSPVARLVRTVESLGVVIEVCEVSAARGLRLIPTLTLLGIELRSGGELRALLTRDFLEQQGTANGASVRIKAFEIGERILGLSHDQTLKVTGLGMEVGETGD